MLEDHARLDEELAGLAMSLRDGDHMLACVQLAESAVKLDHVIRREQRALAYAAVGREHASMRQLVAAIANALDRDDMHRGAELVGTLRSVLLLHAAKTDRLCAPSSAAARAAP